MPQVSANPQQPPPRLVQARLYLVTPHGKPVPHQRFVLNGKIVRADGRGEFFYKDMQRDWYPHVLSWDPALILRVNRLAREKDYTIEEDYIIVVGRRSETARLEGMLLRPNGERARWMQVTLHRIGATEEEPVARLATDWGGRFVGKALLPGRYQVEVTPGKRRAAVSLPETLTLKAGGAMGRRFTLPPG